jgi:hypothetical protein
MEKIIIKTKGFPNLMKNLGTIMEDSFRDAQDMAAEQRSSNNCDPWPETDCPECGTTLIDGRCPNPSRH